MKRIDIAKTTGQLREYAKNARNQVVIVTEREKPIAALVGIDDVDYESLSLSTNPKFIDIIARSRARMEKEGGIPVDEMRRRLGIPQLKRRPTKTKRRVA